jgi:thiamine-phosphate pyrophosphorylase
MSQPQPELYLLLPPAIDLDGFATLFAEALEAPAVAAVMLWLAKDDEALWRQTCEVLVPHAHARGLPLLVAGSMKQTGTLPADGLHMEAETDEIAAAHRTLGGKRMLGVGGLGDRHHAMLAGEAGADYVFFGSADPAQTKPMPFLQAVSLVEWWSEMFQIPCVAPASEFDEAARLAGAGADFVAVRDLVWNDSRGPGAAIEDLAQAIASVERLA